MKLNVQKILVSIISVIIITIIAFEIWSFSRFKGLGNMTHSYTKPTTSTSDISFCGETGDKIKFSFASDIKNGDLNMVLYDSQGNAVYELEQAKKLETFFVLEYSQTYTLAAEYNDFVGSFRIKVYKVK